MRSEQVIPPPVPDPDNAALVYTAVVLQLKAERADGEDLFARMGRLSIDVLAEPASSNAVDLFRPLTQKKVLTDALQALDGASTKPGCRYDLDYSKGAGILLPHLSDLRNLSRILCATARVQAADGNAAAAWKTAITSMRLAGALRNEPILISQLVRVAQSTMTAETIQALCANTQPTDEEYVTLEERLTALDDHDPLVKAMDSERLLLGEWAFNLPRSQWRTTCALFDGGTRGLLFLGTAFAPLLHCDHAVYLEIMRAFAANSREAYSAGDAVLGEEMFRDVPWYCILTRMLVPALSSVKGKYVSMIAQAQVTRAGLAVLQHRKKHGAYPVDLAALKVDKLVDPFSGKALVYRADPAGFTIYSVGLNLLDDGGTKAKDVKSGDLVWRHTEKPKPE